MLRLAHITDVSKREGVSKIFPSPEALVADSNAIQDLHDICVQRDFPKPEFIETGRSGPAHCPVFSIRCQISSLKTEGTSQSKKAAKQLSASRMLQELQKIHARNVPDTEKKLVPTNQSQASNVHQEIKQKVQSYLDYKRLDDSLKKPLGVKIMDRHKFFENLDDDVKLPIIDLLKSTQKTDTQKFNALKTLFEFPSNEEVLAVPNTNDFRYYELSIEFDKFSCMWIDHPELLHKNVVEYFKVMFGICRKPGDPQFQRKLTII